LKGFGGEIPHRMLCDGNGANMRSREIKLSKRPPIGNEKVLKAAETREKQAVKTNNRAAFGQGPDCPSRDINNNIFEQFC